MTDDEDEVRLATYDGPQTASVGRRRKRRVPAPKANLFWRFLFPVIIAGLALAAFQLWRTGTKAVLDSTDGTVVEVVTDPDAPGYEAFADPTPTMLALHVDDGELVGVTVLARTLLDNGGQIVLVSADLAADAEGAPTLADVYASDGAAGVEAAVGSLFGFGFGEIDEIDTTELGLLLALVEPIAFNLLDDLVAVDADGTTEVWLDRGGKLLDGEVAADVYRWRNPGEVDANRNERQVDLWESWLASIAAADDLIAATLPFDEGLAPYLRAFATGQSDVALLPAVPVDGGSAPTYVLDDEAAAWLADIADHMVPLPTPAPGVDVPTVRLLDGTGDRTIAADARAVVARLSELVVIGNAAEFGLATSTVSYHEEADAPLAEALADQLDAEVVADLRPDEPVDLTVTIGTDWETP
ncbi:MAG: LytR C-terminal domain-containing protein [Actinomycetota bacterium]